MKLSRISTHDIFRAIYCSSLLLCLTLAAAAQAAEPYDSVDQLRKKSLSSEAMVEAAIERINAVDRSGPTLNAVLEINPEALAIAKQMDARTSDDPLHGLPVLLKDNIDTGDKMLTTAGSLALAGAPATDDAFIVQRLRDAGAVILGKTNLSEWANFRSNHAISGWSGRGGQTKNPYVLDRSPCGSSSGSAVAVAAGMAPLAVGTETDGSILCPASMNGIVGIKPSRGLVSRSGIIPLSHSQDTAGPMARTVADAALLLTVLAGSDPNDPATELADEHKTDFTQVLDKKALKGKRIGIIANKLGQHAGTDAVFYEAVKTFKKLGAIVVDDVNLPNLAEISDPEYTVLLYDFKYDINRYLEGRKGLGVKSLSDLIAFNHKNTQREMPFFQQEIFIEAEKKGGLDNPEYTKALEMSRHYAGKAGIDAALEEHNLDALLAPAYTPAFLIDPIFGDGFIVGTSTSAAVSGYPSITVPSGQERGLPIGIVLLGAMWSDAKLIAMAYAFEQKHKAWRPPEFLPTVSSDEQ